MNLLFLYGPPAVGKLTVAKELAAITGYRLFHNQLTVDLVESLFDWGTDLFYDFVYRYRLELMEAAAKAKTEGIIFTFVYWQKHDDAFIREIVRRVQKHKGKVYFIQLSCVKKELFRRVRQDSRKHHGKIKTVKKLRQVMREHELFAPVPFHPNMSINTTTRSPKTVARMIQKYYKLSSV